jgi:hypothetical protein
MRFSASLSGMSRSPATYSSCSRPVSSSYRGLLGQVADLRGDRLAVADVVPGDAGGPGRGAGERRQHPHHRRLPGPVRAEKAVDGAALDREREVVDGERVVVPFGEGVGANRGTVAHGRPFSDCE